MDDVPVDDGVCLREDASLDLQDASENIIYLQQEEEERLTGLIIDLALSMSNMKDAIVLTRKVRHEWKIRFQHAAQRQTSFFTPQAVKSEYGPLRQKMVRASSCFLLSTVALHV
jgi:hypothetical protein